MFAVGIALESVIKLFPTAQLHKNFVSILMAILTNKLVPVDAGTY